MNATPTLSVVIPALNVEKALPATLASLGDVPTETIVVDGGSSDGTVKTAEAAGANIIVSEKGRGPQLKAGAAAATGDWLLFLHADTRLQVDWRADIADFIADPGNRDRAAVFTFTLDDPDPRARRMENLVAWRCRVLGLPYGDQGLLISRAFYDAVGGFRPMALMEDVDIVRRIGKRRLTVLASRAVTSADRYRRGGWWLRPMRNLGCLTLYFFGVPPKLLERMYR